MVYEVDVTLLPKGAVYNDKFESDFDDLMFDNGFIKQSSKEIIGRRNIRYLTTNPEDSWTNIKTKVSEEYPDLNIDLPNEGINSENQLDPIQTLGITDF